VCGVFFFDYQAALMSCENRTFEVLFQIGMPLFATFNLLYWDNYAWGYAEYGWFLYAKVFSVTIAAWVVFARRRVAEGSRACTILNIMLTLMLSVNIVEVMLTDRRKGRWFNVLAGFIVLYGVPNPSSTTMKAHDKDMSGSKTVICQAYTFGWVVAYTIWNWNFGYTFPTSAVSNFIHIAVSFLLNASRKYDKWDCWLHYRAYSLNPHFMTRVGFAPFTQQMMWADITRDVVALIGEILCLVIALGYAVSEWRCPSDCVGNLLLFKIFGRPIVKKIPAVEAQVEPEPTATQASDEQISLKEPAKQDKKEKQPNQTGLSPEIIGTV